ncbi:MAG: Uma2 family endonuclease [Actinobacteria bacterium]|nr:MAG: Uma2 family endonuclease [Actinomycetota bacterium]
MATQPQTGLTYEDLQAFPEDNLRRELIDGELIVTAAPARRHQQVVAMLVYELIVYSKRRGGEVLPAPFDVYFSETNVVEPDVLYVRPENLGRFEKNYLRSAPDLVVEVSSPSTRRLELVRKRDLYERFGVPEYWFVDLDADRVEVYRLHEGRYEPPSLFARSDTLETLQAPGLILSVDALLGPSED